MTTLQVFYDKHFWSEGMPLFSKLTEQQKDVLTSSFAYTAFTIELAAKEMNEAFGRLGASLKPIRQTILCPQCNTLQDTYVEVGLIFDSYVHSCKCGYIVTESDWQKQDIKVYDLPTKRVVIRFINGKQRTFYEAKNH